MRAVYEWCVSHSAEFWCRAPADRDGAYKQPMRGWAGVWSDVNDWEEIAIVPACLRRQAD